MRHVLSNHEEVVKYWAFQRQEDGRCKNMFFRGPIIYSYGVHFPIARIIGHTAVFTTQSCSSSTNRHRCYAQRAASHMPMIYVLSPTVNADSQFEQTCNQVITLLESAKRARVNKPYLIKRAESKVADFNTYARLTSLTPVQIPTELTVDMLKQLLTDRDVARQREAKLGQMRHRVMHGASRYSY